MAQRVRYVRPQQQLEALLAKLPGAIAGRGPDPTGGQARTVLKKAADALKKLIQQAFLVKSRGGRDAAGLRWAALKNPRRPGRGILYVTGKLYRSLRPGGRGIKVRTGPGWFSVGIATKNGIRHHRGTRTIPARRLWPEPNRFPRRWWQVIGHAVAQGLAEVAARAVRQGR